MTQAKDLKWWGELEFEIGQARVWRFGSLYVRITRSLHEWQLEYHRPHHQSEFIQDWEVLDEQASFSKPIVLQRFLFAQTTRHITLLPRLADRSVIIKPINPIFIPPGHHGTLFVSTPLWLSGYVKDRPEPLFDIPINRPKDSWFGPDTLRGELCYATPVEGRTHLEHLIPRAFRAVTPVYFDNVSDGMMKLDRMNLPVPALPLFHQAETGRIWTSQLEVLQDDEHRPPRIRLDHKTPSQAGEVSFIQPPRQAESSLFTMFDTFF